MNTEQRRRKLVALLLLLLPLVPVLALLAPLIVRHVAHDAPQPAVSVIVEQQPEQQVPAIRYVPPVFKIEVKDEGVIVLKGSVPTAEAKHRAVAEKIHRHGGQRGQPRQSAG